MLFLELLRDEALPAQTDGQRAALVQGRNRVLLDGVPDDLMMNPKLAAQSAFTSLDSTTAGKPSLEDQAAWHPNPCGYLQVTALDLLLQLGQTSRFNEKFLTMNMVHIK